nr:putative ribonuclease H-like domain-containing protein [Tanacetum cinerariifolium]
VFTNDNSCVACKKGKQHRASCKTKAVSSVDQPLFRLHMDLFGPTFVKSLSKKSYCLVITDDYSRFSWFCGLKGIKRKFSIPRTPQQNDIAERKNRTLIEAARTLLADSLLPISFWAEAVNTACYVQNRMLVMRPFGCPVTILNTLDPLGKFQRKVDEGFLVGYSVYSKAFRLFNSRTRIVQETLHVNFMENKPNVADALVDGKEHDIQNSVSPSIHSSRSGFRNLNAEFKECNYNSNNGVNAASSSVSTAGQNSINSTNDFSAAGPSNAAMPNLEDLSHDADDVGIDYEEVFAPVARIEAIRLFLAYASFMGFLVYQIDVKSAFLYGTIKEEVYICQPPGFEDLENPDKVYKVVKALYGLHQAPRAWYETLATYLLENGFHRGTIDQTLFIKKQQKDILLVQIYVDDIIFGAPNKALCQSFEKLIKDKFQISSMRELTFFLGLQVKQKKDGIFISQDKYVARKFRLSEGKSASTPIDEEKPLLKDSDGEDVDVHTYRSMIGSLMYLTSSRPDIMFVVCACAQFQVTPQVSHLNAVKRIFRYLKGKPYLGLWYLNDSPFDLVAYSDSDYAGASLDRKSTTRGCQFLGCKKQIVVATSSIEVEYELLLVVVLKVFNSPMLHVLSVEMVINSPWMLSKNRLVQKKTAFGQMATSKESSNPFMGGSLPKTILYSFLHKICFHMSPFEFTFVYLVFTSIDSPLLGVNTPRSDEDRLKLMELMVFLLQKGACDEIGITAGRLSSYCCQANVSAVWLLRDVTRLQALVDKKKIVISEAVIREILQLNDAEGGVCLPNEEIFAGLAQMGYEKPSTKLTFYKAFFFSQWKFLIHTILQSLSAKRTSWNEFSTTMASAVICLSKSQKFNFSKYIFDSLVRNVDSSSKFYMYPRFIQLIIQNQVGDLLTHTTCFISPALTQKVFTNMRRVGKGFSGVETPLFEGMLSVGQPAEEGLVEEQHVENLETDNAAQKLEIVKLKARVKKLEKANQIKSSKLRCLRKVGASKRVDSSDDMEDVFNQERMIADMDMNEGIKLVKDAEVAESEGRHAEKHAEIYNLDLDHSSKVLSMQEDDSEVQEVVEVVTTAKLITKVVTAAALQVSAASITLSAASATIPTAKPTIPVAAPPVVAVYTRKRKGVIIRDPEEELHLKTPAETTKVKDKGKGILVETPKPMKKKDQIEMDAEYARKLQEEIDRDHDGFSKDID